MGFKKKKKNIFRKNFQTKYTYSGYFSGIICAGNCVTLLCTVLGFARVTGDRVYFIISLSRSKQPPPSHY